MIPIFSVLLAVLALASTVRSTGIIIPLYTWPGNNAWDAVFKSIAAHPSTTFYLIINPNSGPGTTEYPDDAFITSVSKLNSYPNTHLLGYTLTDYGARPRAKVESEIAMYAKWSSYTGKNISLSGIFFDVASNGQDRSQLEYYQQVSSTAKRSGLDIVVFNPGAKIMADVPQWFAAADLIVEYENTYTNWLASAPTAHLSLNATRPKQAIILNQTPADASIDTIVQLAKNLGLGALYLCHDADYMSLISVPKIAVAFSKGRNATSKRRP